VTASRWQAVVTNKSGFPFPGARLLELDGFGTLASGGQVPEPATYLAAGLGLAMLGVARRRKA
jgi:hypothetical protein